MADKEGGETTSRGNEWEVVSLTASAYAAAPGQEHVELMDKDKGQRVEEDEGETSRAMFLSDHFVFPPSQHENLPLEPESIEIDNVTVIEDDVPQLGCEEGGRSDTKEEENWSSHGLAIPGIQLFDEKGNIIPICETEFDEGTTLQGINLIPKEQNMYSASKFSSFDSETTIGGSAKYDENRIIPGQIETSQGGLDSDISQLPKLARENKDDESELPHQTWWKRQAASLYARAKEANAFWSVFIAAAVMGLVILGQHWQQERWRALQLKWQCNISDEKMGRMLGPISRLKDVIVGGNRRASSIRSSSSTER